MTLQRARQLLQDQVDFGGFYNRNAATLILAGVHREHGQAAVEKLVRDLELGKTYGVRPGTTYETP